MTVTTPATKTAASTPTMMSTTSSTPIDACQRAADALAREEPLHGPRQVQVQAAGTPEEADERDDRRRQRPGSLALSTAVSVMPVKAGKASPTSSTASCRNCGSSTSRKMPATTSDERRDEREERRVGEAADDEAAAGAAVDDLDADASAKQRIAHQQRAAACALMRPFFLGSGASASSVGDS